MCIFRGLFSASRPPTANRREGGEAEVARHRGRELALQVLFEYDLAAADPRQLTERATQGESPEDQAFVESLVLGVLAGRPAIDRQIEDVAIEWKVGRMPTVDRNILRLGAFELTGSSGVPIAVIIAEALELADSYSSGDEAKRFINGVLGKMAKQLRPEGDLDRSQSSP